MVAHHRLVIAPVYPVYHVLSCISDSGHYFLYLMKISCISCISENFDQKKIHQVFFPLTLMSHLSICSIVILKSCFYI